MEFFDLHCDTITKFYEKGYNLCDGNGEINLEKSKQFKKYKQVFAVFINDNLRGEKAWEYFLNNVNYFNKQISLSSFNKDNAILSIEGGAAIGGDLSRIEKIRELGVKLFTLTWNGENELGYGVSENKGLKPLGVQAVSALENNGIIVDVSHLSYNGFYDVASIAKKPFIASHSNSRAICNNKRNLTDEQFLTIKSVNGLVGINFHQPFVTENDDYNLSILRHIYHFLSLGGENNVAIGSDFDGAAIHECLNSLDKIPSFYQICVDNFGEEVSKKIFYNNANLFFQRKWSR